MASAVVTFKATQNETQLTDELRLLFNITLTKTGKIRSIRSWKLYTPEGEGVTSAYDSCNSMHWHIKGLLEASNDPIHKAILAKW